MKKLTVYILSIVICLYASASADTIDFCNDLSWDSADAECLYNIGEISFHIFHNGRVKVDLSGNPQHQFKIVLPKYFFVESAGYYIAGKEIVFTFGITDSDSGNAIIALYDTTKLNLKWQTEIGAFNISEPLIANNAVYVGAIGTAAKIDIHNGSLAWIHKDLYEPDATAFNSFGKPTVWGDCIKFIENKTDAANYPDVKEVMVDDSTGKIVTAKECKKN